MNEASSRPTEAPAKAGAAGAESVPVAVLGDRSAERVPSGVTAHLEEMRAAIGQILQTQADLLRAKARHAVMLAILACLALVVAVTLIVTTVVLLLKGVSGGLAQLLGHRLWLGELLTAVIVVVAAWITLRVWCARTDRKRAALLAKKYEKGDAQRSIPVHDGSRSDVARGNQIP